MVILGLLLLGVGLVLVLLGLFTSEVRFQDDAIRVEIANIDLSIEAVFLAGVVAATLVYVGLWAVKIGAKQGWKHRREQKRLTELSEKLDRAEAERRAKTDADDGL